MEKVLIGFIVSFCRPRKLILMYRTHFYTSLGKGVLLNPTCTETTALPPLDTLEIRCKQSTYYAVICGHSL